jgi:hypothetical protein
MGGSALGYNIATLTQIGKQSDNAAVLAPALGAVIAAQFVLLTGTEEVFVTLLFGCDLHCADKMQMFPLMSCLS